MRHGFERPPDPIPDSLLTETIECDVAVVGAGISGTPAAIRAAELGARVHVLEKGPTHGKHRTGGFAAFGTKAQKAAGIELSEELRERIVIDLWCSSMAFQGRLPLSSLWMRYSAEVADWLSDILASKGIQVRAVDTAGITGPGLRTSLVRPNQFWNEYCLLHRMGRT
jgi:fumarate reductase flavoprotein subunit